MVATAALAKAGAVIIAGIVGALRMRLVETMAGATFCGNTRFDSIHFQDSSHAWKHA